MGKWKPNSNERVTVRISTSPDILGARPRESRRQGPPLHRQLFRSVPFFVPLGATPNVRLTLATPRRYRNDEWSQVFIARLIQAIRLLQNLPIPEGVRNHHEPVVRTPRLKKKPRIGSCKTLESALIVVVIML